MSAREEPGPAQPPQDAPPPGQRAAALRTSVRTLGEVCITLGVVVLLFVVYELYVTNFFAATKQADASRNLAQRWAGPERQLHVDPAAGKAFARIYIPSFGADYNFTIQEGVGAQALSVGPGHYVDSAMPGEPGNFAIAGHRVGKGAPFNDLDLLKPCDAMVIETATDFFVYRVLPMDDEVRGWKKERERRPECASVSTLRSQSSPKGGPYSKTLGRKIVDPSVGSAVAAVPYRPQSRLPKSDQVSLLTLTTCHPQFSAQQRMIIHGVLVQQFKKSPNGGGYEQVLREIGGG